MPVNWRLYCVLIVWTIALVQIYGLLRFGASRSKRPGKFDSMIKVTEDRVIDFDNRINL